MVAVITVHRITDQGIQCIDLPDDQDTMIEYSYQNMPIGLLIKNPKEELVLLKTLLRVTVHDGGIRWLEEDESKKEG